MSMFLSDKGKNMNQTVKIRLVLFFVLVFSIFMHGGLHQPGYTDAAISFQGEGTFTAGFGALSVPVPAGYQDGDVFLLFVNSANQAITVNSAGWTEVANSPQGTGAAGFAGGVRLAVFYKVVSGAQANVSVADSGTYTAAMIANFRGVDTTTPIHLTAGSVDAAATANISTPSLTTTIANTLIVNAIGLDKDLNDTNTITTAPVNANLTNLTEQHDQTVTSGAGGGIAYFTGDKATAGAVGNTTATADSSTTHAYITVALTPAPISVTIDQAIGQADPTNSLPINFTIVFSQAIDPATFAGSDVTITGTAGGTKTVTLTTSDNITWNAAVNGATSSGTVIASLTAGVIADPVGILNTASTSTDNTVTYDITPPSVTINQAVGQADPTGSTPINFTIVFSEAINPATFTASDVTITGTAGATTVTLTTSDNITWNAAVSGLTSAGTVIAGIAANAVQDPVGNNNNASTSTDNTVTWTLQPVTTSCTNGGKDGPVTISGMVNTYYPGNGSPAAGATSIPVGTLDARGSVTAISTGDLLLVIQMQDADIDASNNSAYGDGLNAGSGYTALNQAGLYEYVTATGPVAAGSVPIQGSGAGNGLANSYRTRAYVAGTNGQSTFQVIRVPQYSAATIASATAVAAPSWNGSTGGVVIMDVAGTLTVDGTVDADGLGFRGGMGRQLTGGAGANTDYRTLATNAANGSKGEGIAGTPRYMNSPAAFNGAPVQVDTTIEGYPNGSYGRGAPGNAGGGGTDGDTATNQMNSGGGGGANYGSGGKGGNSWNNFLPVGGEGGSLITGLAYNRVVMGGGGGAGTTNNGTAENFTYTDPPGIACSAANGACSSGAPGGGLVILRAKLFAGSGSVSARGGSAYNVANDSGGGGGAGGSIILYSQLGGTVNAYVDGGDGGNAWRTGGTTLADRHGPGGGGGGGFLAYSPQTGFAVNASYAGGISGKTTTLNDNYGSTSADGGIYIFDYPIIPGLQSSADCLPVLTVSKSTTTPAISGLPGTATYSISVTNSGTTTAEQVVISDTLPGVPALFTNASAAPTIAYNPNSAPCNTSRTSTTNAATGISNPAWSNWDIPAGCAVSLTFNATVPAGTVPTTYQNPATVTYLDPERTTPTGTRSVTYNPGSSTAEDVNVLAPPSISEAFGAASILAGGSTTLTMTLTNPNAAAITALGFTNNLPTAAAGAPGNVAIVNPPVPSTTCGGSPAYTAINGTGTFTVSGLTIPANGSCIVTITVTAPTNGIYVNTIPAGAISSSAGTNTDPATASLLVGNVANPNVLMPPTMTKSFLTNPLLTGGTSVLRFVLTNPNPARPIGSAGFIDTLPTELVIANPNGLSNGCGGTVSAVAGSNYISLNTDGTIPAGSTCTVDVNVTARYPGIYQNTSGQVVGDTGTGNTASDTLRVMTPLVVDKDFVTNPVAIGTATVLRIILTNPNAIAVTGAAFTDTYPSGLVNTATPNPTMTGAGCSGTVTAPAGPDRLVLAGGSIPANSSCTITVNVQATASGSFTNSTGAVTTTNAGTAVSASSTLNVLSPPLVRKVFSPEIMSSGGQSGMQIVISNPSSNPATLTGVALSDTYTGNMTNAAAGSVLCTTGSSATLTGGANGGTTVGISGGSILPGGSCMIVQLVTAATNNTNTTTAPTSTNAGTGVAATAVLKVMQPLLVAKSFSNSHPVAGANVTMTIALTNPNPAAVKNAAFLDTYPANLVNAAAPAPTFTPAGCAGTGASLTAVAAGNTLRLSNGTIAANTTCSITVVVTMNLANVSQINNTGNITTANAGTSPGDSATISTGTGIAPVELTKTFTPGTINVGQTSTLQFTITNPVGGAAPANTIAFTDILPAGLTAPNGVTAGVCGVGSTLTIAGGNTITLAAGTIATALPTNCIFNVTVTGVAAGSYVNRTGQITQAGPIVGNYAEAAIEVKTAPSVTKSFGAAYLAPGATTQLTIRIDNPNSTAITTSANFDDIFPATPGAMTLANGIVSNNTCSLPVQDSNGATLISSTSVVAGSDFSATNVAATAPGANPTTTLSGTYTVGSGANRLLMVAVELETAAAGDTVTFNSATYGGQNLTSLVMAGAAFRNRIWVGYLNEAGISAAASTTLSVTLNSSANPSAAILKAAYFTSVDQTTPIYHNVSNFSDAASTTFNFGGTPLNVIQNGRAIYLAAFNNGPTATPAPGFTELFDQADPSANFSTEGASRTVAATTTDSGTNITLTAAQRYGVVAFTLNPNVYTGTLPGGVRIPNNTSIPAGGCEFTVSVTASSAGMYTNTIAAGALQTNAGNNASAASAALVIPKLGPLVTEVFVPAAINAGGTSRLIMTFENPNAVAISLTSLFTNTLPAGVVLAGTPNIVTTCSDGTGGSTAANNVTLSSGAVIPAGTFEGPGSCTLSVDVTAAASGIYADTVPAGDLQTTAGGNADPASAVLTVQAISPPTVSKAFGDVSIGNTGVVSRLVITLSNTNATAATLSANLVDTLPADLVIATPNGLSGTCTLVSVSAVAGAGTITYASGATIPAGGCTIVVNVTSTIVAVYTNTIAAGALQTNLGNNPGPTSDTLFVVPTLVTLSDFSAYNDNGRFVVQWSTSSEIDTAGFYLFRLDEKTGRFRQINSSLLPALLTSQQGGTYSLIDNGASLTKSNTYLLMEIEGKGRKNSYGPFTVTAGAGNALENHYVSAPRSAEAFLSKKIDAATPQARMITRYADNEGTIIVANSSKASRDNESQIIDEVSGYTRTAKTMSAVKKAALDSRIEAKARTSFLKKQKTGTMVKITIDKDGLYFMDAAEISALLGLSETKVRQMIRSGKLALSNQGRSIAYIPAEDMTGLFFYGQGIDSMYTDENIYWLYKGRGLQMNSLEGNGPDPAGYSSIIETIHAEEDKTVAPSLADGPLSDYWFWDYVISGNPSLGTKHFDLQVFGVADSSSLAALTATLHGVTATGVNNEHHVSISLNGTAIGEDRWKGTEEHLVNLSFSQALLTEGTNTIEVKGLLDAGVPYSIFFVDSFDMTYRRLLAANDDSLTFSPESPLPLTVYGFSRPDISVFDITHPDRPSLNSATTIDGSDGDYSISFVPSPGSRYLATASDAADASANAWADSPSTLSSRKNMADYVIITTKELVTAAQELANYRQGQGLKSMVVDIENIMDEFNYGISSPEAVHAFLAYAHTSWKKAPKYVLLAGDGTYDYKDNMGIGDNLVPTLMTETPEVIAPSDNLFADFDGDHVPDIAIGRIPALTAQELQSVIAKIIAYESTAGSRIVMLADNQDTGGKFPADSDDIAALVPAGYSVSKIYLSDLTLPQARLLLFNEIQTGALLLNYTGHAGVDLLASEGLLRASDVTSLQNSERPFVLAAMTCTVGNFALPGFDSLSETLVTRDRGGAVAVWAPTGLSYNYLSKVLDEEFFRGGLGHRGVALGDVILGAFRNYQTTGKPAYIMDIFNLQGDPALRMW